MTSVLTPFLTVELTRVWMLFVPTWCPNVYPSWELQSVLATKAHWRRWEWLAVLKDGFDHYKVCQKKLFPPNIPLKPVWHLPLFAAYARLLLFIAIHWYNKHYLVIFYSLSYLTKLYNKLFRCITCTKLIAQVVKY